VIRVESRVLTEDAFVELLLVGRPHDAVILLTRADILEQQDEVDERATEVERQASLESLNASEGPPALRSILTTPSAASAEILS
jgi:hypothetical protein